MDTTEPGRRMDVVFAGRFPMTNQSEGLFVLLCDLVRPLVADGIKVLIHVTDRHTKGVHQALVGNGLFPSELLVVKVHRVGSLTLKRIDQRLFPAQRAPKRGFAKRTVYSIADALSRATRSLTLLFADITATNFVSIVVWAALALVLGLLASVLLIPLIAVGLAVSTGASMAKRSLRWVVRQVRTRRLLRPVRIVLGATLASYRRAKADLSTTLYIREQKRLASALDKDISSKKLLFFTCFEGHLISTLKHKRSLVVFPDAVVGLYATRFPEAAFREVLEAMRLAVASATALICYSEFVRDKQLLAYYPQECKRKPIEVIPQPHSVPSSDAANWAIGKCINALNDERIRVKNFFPTLMQRAPGLTFGAFEYVVYPTVDRQHKNLLTVVRATAHLLRQRFRNIKLVLTTPHITQDVRWYIESERLQYDIIFMPSVPMNVLELLFRCAAVSVHASLAEGGLPFTFSRSVRMHTPVLLADVPVVRESLGAQNVRLEQAAGWLFNPVDDFELARKLEATLDNRKEIAEEQSKVLLSIGEYDVRHVAYRYLDLYEHL